MSVVHTEPREGRSSSIAKQLRRAGYLPMAILHPKGEPELIKAKAAEVKKALHETPGVGIFEIQMPKDKRPRTVLVKHVDYEPVTKAIIHMTLQEVHTSDTVQLSVPLKPIGENRPLTHNAGVLMRPNHHIRIKCHVSEVPHEIDVDISDLKIGDSVTAAHVPLPPNVELVSPPEEVVFYLKPMSKAELAPEAEEIAEGVEIPAEAIAEEAPAEA